MATNTAFGTLASPITQLFGGNAGGGMAGAPPQQKKPVAQQGLAPGTSPTFAQLQQQGQARPAPAAGMAPAAAAAPQQPPMLSALNTQLNQPPAAAPAPAPAAPAPARTFTPQELTTARERFQGLKDTAIANISTAAAQWGVGGNGAGPAPAEALKGFFAGGDQGNGMGTSSAEGVYGANWDENGLPVANWRPNNGSAQTFQQAFPEDLREALAAAQAEDAAAAAATRAAQPKQAALETQSWDKLPDSVKTQLNKLPAWTAGGYAQGGSSGGYDAGNVDMNFLRDTTGRQFLLTKDQEGNETGRYASNTEIPFSLSQQKEQAQTQPAAAINYQSSGAFGGSSQAQALRARLEQQLNDLSQNEAQIQGQSYSALRKAKMDEMGAEFGAQRSQLEEDLARRGLSASTIGGGRYGDLAGQQARATASFEADLLKQQAEAEAENRKVYLSGMSELAGMAGQQDLGAFEANLKSRQADADISLRTQELQQKAQLEGRSLNLQEARDLATKEYQGGQLQQGYAEISSRERMSASDIASRQQMQQSQFGFDKEQSALERSLRETMQTRELTSEETRQLAQITANKALQTDQQTFQAGQNAANNAFQASQSVLERGLRETMQTRELTAAEARQLAGIEADKLAAGVRNTFEAGQAGLTRTFQGDQSQLDRDLRTTLSANELNQAKTQFDQRFGLDKAQTDNQFLATLASTLAPMKQADRDAFLASLGIKKPTYTAPGSPSTDTGGF